MKTLTESPELQLAGLHNHTHTPAIATAKTAPIVRARKAAEGIGSRSAAVSKLRLGATVRHAGFGTGQVIANWPDGTVIVRFEGASRNRKIWPAHLTRLSGGRD